jgi:hypothetical protein
LIERCLALQSAGAIDLRDRLGALGGEHVDLALGGGEPGFCVLHLRGAGTQCRVGLLRTLHRAGAGLHQPVVAGLFFLREFEIGFRRVDISRALLDDRLLQGELRIEVADRSFGSGDIGIGLRQRGPEVAVVDLGQ